MGATTSAPLKLTGLDPNQATYSAPYLATLQNANAKIVADANKAIATGGIGWAIVKFVLLPIVLILGGILGYDAIAIKLGWPTALLPSPQPSSSSSSPPVAPPSGNVVPPSGNLPNLLITEAIYGIYGKTVVDVSSILNSRITNNILPSFVVSWQNLGLSEEINQGGNNLEIAYTIGTSAPVKAQYTSGSTVPNIGSNVSQSWEQQGMQDIQNYAAPPPFLLKFYNSLFGNSSGNLAPSFHDATTTSLIPGNRAPLSAEREGGYGMQWWMYVKDWNYGYGKKKSIVKRPDATNSGITNPLISLHPTDNSLQVSVSIYPSTDGGSGKAEPAPAGHSGSSDDVFVCEVPNIPLQTWFSVSVTVFGRNLDIYLDGKLVKSCFLTGVPKPAVGDISLTPDGGFSGRICNFYHYPKMLTPSDALSFWSAGTTCKNQTTSGKSSATGYSVKFGLYDALGKEVQEYAF